jgi:hypothetical protein
MMKRLTKNGMAGGAVILTALFAIATPTATADTSALRLGCFVDSPNLDTVKEDHCVASHPASSYKVYFEVRNRSAGGYSYQWRKTGLPVSGGCTASSHSCSLVVVKPKGESTLTMWVVVTELATGASKTVTADAEFFAVCGKFFC